MRSILTALQESRLFELPEAGKARALEFLARIIDANPDIEVGTDAIEEIQKRELECNTGIGMGVGIPHIRARREEGELFCAIGWSAQGIDYGSPDGEHVHLVVMYYIPGAQKNVYLKEISTLVKAMRKSGGIEPIAHAADLNAVRNLLLDWISTVLGDTGPEAVARMIKLDVRQTQVPAAIAAPAPLAAAPGRSAAQVGTKAVAFHVLVGPITSVVLAVDAGLFAALEKENQLSLHLATGAPFTAAGRQIFVVGVRSFAGARVLYDCIAIEPTT
jgi:mannitol/fructose-specific phosphotransferase system IIA component (Ntr-type)